MHSMGEPVPSLLLPVIPDTMDADKKGLKAMNEDAPFRVLSPSAVLPRQQRNAINQATLQRAATVVAEAGTVLVAPTGPLADAGKAPWQRGIGSIIRMTPRQALTETRIAFVRLEDFSKLHFIAALALRQIGRRLPRQTITIRAIDAGTPAELLGASLDSGEAGDKQITEGLRQEYLKHFGDTLVRR